MADENEDSWLYGDSEDNKQESFKLIEVPSVIENTNFDNQDEEYLQNDEIIRNYILDHVENTKVLEADTQISNSKVFNNETLGDDEEHQNLHKFDNENPVQLEVKENGDCSQIQDDGDVASDTDSEDDVHVVIGDIKTTQAQYSSLNIKRGGLISSSGVTDKLKQQPGKFSIDEFETIGSINGISAHEYNLDQLEDKPWRQPGADITDYFNYGFNEETWRAYCERQKRMRSESGVGLVLSSGTCVGQLGGVLNSFGGRIPQVTITNYNSKYSGVVGPKRAGPPPGRKMAGTIDVIGSSGLGSRRNTEKSPPKENVIQVMTADRREYSRKGPPPTSFPDMSVPPPMAPLGPPGMPSFDMPPPGYMDSSQYFTSDSDPYYNSYEPTQDRQWNESANWQPANISIPLSGNDVNPQSVKTMSSLSSSSMTSLIFKERDKDREYDLVARDREKDRDKESLLRDREMESSSRDVDIERHDRERSRSVYKHKDRHRHRSRSRSRRHKSSRSRSPTRRKKKSRRSEREKSKEESE